MSAVTFQELISHVGVSDDALKEPCTEAHLSTIALWLPDWQIVAPHLGVCADVHDSTDPKEKNQYILNQWKQRFAFKATYKCLVEVLLEVGRADVAEKVCSLLVSATGDCHIKKLPKTCGRILVLQLVLLVLVGLLWLPAFEDKTQINSPKAVPRSQALQDLIVIGSGSRPSLSNILSLYVPGPKKIKIVETATAKWKRLALELGFTLQEIDSTGSGYSDPEQDCFLMLRKWLEHKYTTVTWETLIMALKNVGFTHLAEDLWKATGDYWLPGANVIGLATSSVNRNTKLIWKEYGFALTLPCTHVCNVTVAASLSEGVVYKLPSTASLVSVLYYIQLSKEPSTPVTVEVDHLALLNSSRKTVMFGIARNKPLFQFQLYPGDFTSREQHGRIEISEFPIFLAVFQLPSSSILETVYTAHVFCDSEGPHLWTLTVVTAPRLTAYEQLIKKEYPLSSWRKKLMSFLFEFDTNSVEISLDHQVQNLKQYQATCQKQTFMNTVLESKPSTQNGIVVNENWTITPKKINKIYKQEFMEIQYNNFLPTFEFILQYLPTAEKFELLQFCTFILTGAKEPHNFFRILLDPSTEGFSPRYENTATKIKGDSDPRHCLPKIK